MKTIPLVPACQNIMELKKLAELISEYMHPEMIILFGHYAGMPLASTHRGYELLILTRDKPDITYPALQKYLQQHYPSEERTEKHLSVFLFPQEVVLQMTSRSYFLSSIRKEGILLYRSDNCRITDRVRWKPGLACRHLTAYAEHSLQIGKNLLEDAQRHFEQQVYPLTAFYLYQAALEFSRCVAHTYYGFVPEIRNDLFTTYAYIRHTSEVFTKLWATSQDPSGTQLLKRLSAYKQITTERNPLQPESLVICIEKLKQFQESSENYCNAKIAWLREGLAKS